MANENGNPNIAEYGRATRFGAGNDAHSARALASPPWSIRNALRQMAAAPVDTSKPITIESLLNGIGRTRNCCSAVEYLAASLFVEAMSDYRVMDKVTNIIDGKLRSPRCKADVPDLATLVVEASSARRSQ